MLNKQERHDLLIVVGYFKIIYFDSTQEITSQCEDVCVCVCWDKRNRREILEKHSIVLDWYSYKNHLCRFFFSISMYPCILYTSVPSFYVYFILLLRWPQSRWWSIWQHKILLQRQYYIFSITIDVFMNVVYHLWDRWHHGGNIGDISTKESDYFSLNIWRHHFLFF